MQIKYFGRKSETLERNTKNAPESVSKETGKETDKELVNSLKGSSVALFCFYDYKGFDKSKLTSSGFSLQDIDVIIAEAKEVGIYDAAVQAHSLGE